MKKRVKDSIVEIRENALRTMLEKNHKSTYSNMNPRDTIEVKRGIRDTILPDDSFEINMDIAEIKRILNDMPNLESKDNVLLRKMVMDVA